MPGVFPDEADELASEVAKEKGENEPRVSLGLGRDVALPDPLDELRAPDKEQRAPDDAKRSGPPHSGESAQLNRLPEGSFRNIGPGRRAGTSGTVDASRVRSLRRCLAAAYDRSSLEEARGST
jgi:hypothetical protein